MVDNSKEGCFSMRRLKWALIIMFLSGAAHAHDMTPTYPKLEISHVDGIYKTKMEIFNKRQDVEWYEIGVFDGEWNSIPFVSTYKVIKLPYLGHMQFEIYIRGVDKQRATYVCSKSKIKKEGNTKTAISSKICSKFK